MFVVREARLAPIASAISPAVCAGGSQAISHPMMRPVIGARSAKAIATGDRTIEFLRDRGFPPEIALQMTRALRDYTIGHAMGLAAVRLGAQRRSRKPKRGTPGYGPLAESADAVGLEEHFDLGLAAMLDGFERWRR